MYRNYNNIILFNYFQSHIYALTAAGNSAIKRNTKMCAFNELSKKCSMASQSGSTSLLSTNCWDQSRYNTQGNRLTTYWVFWGTPVVHSPHSTNQR